MPWTISRGTPIISCSNALNPSCSNLRTESRETFTPQRLNAASSASSWTWRGGRGVEGVRGVAWRRGVEGVAWRAWRGGREGRGVEGVVWRRGVEGLDELLVAHLPVLVAVHQRQQHVQLGRVQLQLVVLQQAAEVLHCDEAGVVRVQLEEHRTIRTLENIDVDMMNNTQEQQWSHRRRNDRLQRSWSLQEALR
ncbi:hypothetical protein EYF80_050148 [Liparis tanakae]|uniref:Uncharacterized protein n=1 Tax=Liparis tanakae TaxID=230148 RepID=A0A4Z2FG30_9TELE|nr:hypothetical protein EYF80_050148 [Liparis tanakae]